VRKIGLFVERSLLQTETVGNVQNGLRSIFDAFFLSAFSRRIATDIKALSSNVDFGAVSFVGNAVNLLEIVRIGNDFVAGDNILLVDGLAGFSTGKMQFVPTRIAATSSEEKPTL
jgi:hypothetical protein